MNIRLAEILYGAGGDNEKELQENLDFTRDIAKRQLDSFSGVVLGREEIILHDDNIVYGILYGISQQELENIKRRVGEQLLRERAPIRQGGTEIMWERTHES